MTFLTNEKPEIRYHVKKKTLNLMFRMYRYIEGGISRRVSRFSTPEHGSSLCMHLCVYLGLQFKELR